MEEIVRNKSAQAIYNALEAQFKPKIGTRYGLMVVNDPYDRFYNVFFNYQRHGQRSKSIPLYCLNTYELTTLETVINSLSTMTALSIQYVGFTGQRWPGSQKLIKRKRVNYE